MLTSLTFTKADVTIGDDPPEQFSAVRAAVSGGVLRIMDRGGRINAEFSVTEVMRQGRDDATVTLADGRVAQLHRDCGCGSARSR